MSEDFGSDFITIVDDDGTEFELELLDTMDYKGQTFVAFLPADMDENDPDYGLVILRSVSTKTGMSCSSPSTMRMSFRMCMSILPFSCLTTRTRNKFPSRHFCSGR